MQCIWRRICMIHMHIQEPTQRDNFNINPSAVCLLCSEMLHRIIQIFIVGSSAATLLAAFVFFFFLSLSWAILPSFLCTESVACAQHHPSASSSWRFNSEAYLRSSGPTLCCSHWSHAKEQGCISSPCTPAGEEQRSLLCSLWCVPFWDS